MAHDRGYEASASELSIATDAALDTLAWSEHVYCDEHECYAAECPVTHYPETYDDWFIEWGDAARDTMRTELTEFIAANSDDLHGLDYSDIGYDFTLTRNGHGTGFWDRGLGERGERLSDAARAYGSIHPCIINADAANEEFKLGVE